MNQLQKVGPSDNPNYILITYFWCLSSKVINLNITDCVGCGKKAVVRKLFAMCSSICWPPGDSPATIHSPVKPPKSKCSLGLDKIKNQRIKEFVSSDWFCARVLVRVPDQCDDPGDDPLVTCQPTVQCHHLPHLRPRLYPQPATSTDIETTGSQDGQPRRGLERHGDHLLHHQPDYGEQADLQQHQQEERGEQHLQQQHRDNFPDRKVRGTQRRASGEKDFNNYF